MIIRGPFSLTWGSSTLADIESIEIEHEISTEEYEANSGQTFEIEKSRKTYIKITLLATDIPSLAAVLPQYFVPQSSLMHDGSYVVDSRGAIDVVADDCDTEMIYHKLEIFACANPTESFKVFNCRTVIDSIEIGKVRKIVVKFIGEPEAGSSLFQFLGDQGEADFFQLGDNDLFILGDDTNLIL